MADQLPQHVGFIVDGNRRWAVSRGLKPSEGHKAGYDVLHEILTYLFDLGVSYGTVYVFSTENWKRNPGEVRALLNLLYKLLTDDIPIFIEKNVRLRIAGMRNDPRISKKMRRAFEDAEQATAYLTRGTLVLCINYGGRQELVDASKKIVQSGIAAQDITESTLQEMMYVPEVPPIDLIVRTSGEHRLSNFMLWQSYYAELMFIDTLWPDLTNADIDDILEEYKTRNRRFGG